MALITSCQATFQNFSGYEDDLASLEENIRECYSEITKTSEQINMSVREEFYFPLGIGDHPEGFLRPALPRTARRSGWISQPLRMRLRKTSLRTSCFWRSISGLKVRSLNWEKSGTPSRPNYPMRNWPLRRTAEDRLYLQPEPCDYQCGDPQQAIPRQ